MPEQLTLLGNLCLKLGRIQEEGDKPTMGARLKKATRGRSDTDGTKKRVSGRSEWGGNGKVVKTKGNQRELRNIKSSTSKRRKRLRD